MRLVRLSETFTPNRTTRLLGICIPTVEPSLIHEWLLSDDMLTALEPLRDISVFLINFQPPFNDTQINRCVKKLTNRGFQVNYKFNQYDTSNGIYFCKIREDTAAIDPNCPFYLLLEDDMTARKPTGNHPLSLGQQYLTALKYMIDHRTCGEVSFTWKPCYNDPYYSSVAKDTTSRIYPLDTNHCHFGMLNSMMIRNLGVFDNKNYCLHPTDAQNNVIGGGDDIIMPANLLSNGYYIARYIYANNLHKATNASQGSRGGWMSDETQKSGFRKYINDKYGYKYDLVPSVNDKNKKVDVEVFNTKINHQLNKLTFDELSLVDSESVDSSELLSIQANYRSGNYKFGRRSSTPF